MGSGTRERVLGRDGCICFRREFINKPSAVFDDDAGGGSLLRRLSDSRVVFIILKILKLIHWGFGVLG